MLSWHQATRSSRATFQAGGVFALATAKVSRSHTNLAPAGVRSLAETRPPRSANKSGKAVHGSIHPRRLGARGGEFKIKDVGDASGPSLDGRRDGLPHPCCNAVNLVSSKTMAVARHRGGRGIIARQLGIGSGNTGRLRTFRMTGCSAAARLAREFQTKIRASLES